MKAALLFTITFVLMTGTSYGQRLHKPANDTTHFNMTGTIYGGKMQSGSELRFAVMRINDGPHFSPDTNARYHVRLKKGDVMYIRCLGFLHKKIKMNKRQDTLNVLLSEAP